MKKFSPDITKGEINNLPLIQFEGKIHLIDNEDKVVSACEHLRQNDILGFDTETRPSFKKGKSFFLSLMQFSTQEECYLFRINKLGIPKELRQLLEDERVKKVGFDLNSDFHQIRKRVSDINLKNFVDLKNLAKEIGIKDVSLRKLTAIVLGHRLSKRQRLSNWEQDELKQSQKVYAATDAWITLILYKKLIEIEKD